MDVPALHPAKAAWLEAVRRARVATLAALSTLAISACGPRTAPDPIQPAQLSGQYVLDQLTRDRWVHASQRPEFTPFLSSSTSLHLDLAPADPRTGERTIRVHTTRVGSGDSALLTVRADGRAVGQQAWLRPPPSVAMFLPGDSARMARFRLLVGRRLVLPLARVWDVVPVVRPRRFTAGERWSDTISLATEYDGMRQSLAGVRTSTLVADTVVDGRRIWIVRDSALVRYTERELEVERTVDTLVAITRSVSGTIRGRYLYDRELGLLRSRDDTTALAGEAALEYPDGRTFRTSVRYERMREWRLYEPSAYAARQAELMAERRRTSTGPVAYPMNETERRLSSGDSALRDSLVAAWERERDPDRRDELHRLLLRWAGGGQAFRTTLDARRVAAGDSAFALQQLWRRAYPAQPPIDVGVAREMIRVMSDPGISFGLGLSRDPLYENLVQTLTTWPPALDPDRSRWRCTPEACRLLGDQWRSAREPRLRDVGLAVLVTLDPARWTDTAIARAAEGSSLLQRVAQLANGVGATWRAAAKLAIPPPGADWRAWLAWANAPNASYRPPPAGRTQANAMRFEGSHATAIRFYQARTGRDVVGELRRRYAAATEDSARLVFGTIVMGLGGTPALEEMAAQFRSGSPALIALAQRSLGTVFGARGPPADSATASTVVDRLIASLVDGTEPWPSLARPQQDTTVRLSAPPAGAAPPSAMYVLADSIPPALRERWRDRVRFIGLDEWQRLSVRDAATLLTVSSVERVGPFVRVTAQSAGRLARGPDEAPQLFYSGRTYYLLGIGDGWVVVATEMWIT